MYEIERDPYTEQHRRGPGCLYWLLWVFANVAAFMLGGLLGQALEDLIMQPNPEAVRVLALEGRIENRGAAGYTSALAGGLVASALLAIAQGLVLRPYFKPRLARRWLAVTVMGGTLRWLAIFITAQSLIGLVIDKHLTGTCLLFGFLVGSGCVAGIALGLPQSVLLRERVLHPNWWVLANMAGPAATGALIAFGLLIVNENVFRDWTLPIAAIIGSATTGVTIIELLKHPRPGVEWEADLKWKPEKKTRREPAEDTVLGSTLYARPTTPPENSATHTQESLSDK